MRTILNKAQRLLLESQIYNSPEWKKRVRRTVNEKMKKIQADLLESFHSHPVTKELKMGSLGTNISGTLGGVDGNLFGFIGFDLGFDPIKDLILILSERKVMFVDTQKGTSVKIFVPSKKEIFDQTPLPWASGRSWAKSIELGLSGLGRYLKSHTPASRSKVGIQTKGKLRTGKFRNVSYLSPMLKKYYKRIEKLESQF